MQVEVFAESSSEAIDKVRSELKIDKIEPIYTDIPEVVKDLFGILK